MPVITGCSFYIINCIEEPGFSGRKEPLKIFGSPERN
jgi:hypothetical protein